MPNQKKKKSDEKQKSLFSYVDKSASEVAEQKDNVKDESKTISISEKKDHSPEETSQNGPLKKVYMDETELNFGFKEKDIKLESLKKEAVSSKYIRYLIAAGEIVNDLKTGLLLDVDYDGGQNKAYCKFYDLESDEIKIWIDSTDHEPYCLSKEPIESLKKINKLTNYSGFKRFETVKKTDLLIDKEIPLTKIYGNTPSDIGGSGNNIKNILAENEIKAWEADIRYHLNYIFDTEIIPGLIYKIENGALHKISFEEEDEKNRNLSSQIRNLFKSESKEIQEFSEKFSDIFLTPIPDVKRVAMDIEVELGVNEFKVPNPREAKQRVISVSFVGSDGLKAVYVLEREGFEFTKLHEKFPPDAKLFFFKNEKDLLIETFRKIWKYPILLTFNGDNFDLNYLFHRANKLKVSKKLNPIRVKRGFGIMSSAECDLVKGIHIDLFNFFFNRSISGYAFGGAYTSNSLNAISSALLGREKYQHEEEIHDMEYDILSWYNLKDSILTLDLTKFNNSLVWNLIILLCRITKMPIHETVRRQISTWIQNIFYFEHRRRNFLIPRRSEISELKEGGYSKSVIEGKSFQGAYVVQPVPGIHFNVVVMDFASLYPSIIKEYNLSYETVSCPHEDCSDNLIKGIPYHVCTHKMGIFAYVVGYFRDIRVKFFKPLSGDNSLTPKQRAYYTTIQQALKVFINGSYGVFGSKNFPLFCLPVAESTTGIGQYSIKQTIKKAESLGVKVLYGDSVTGDTPLLLKSKNKISVKRIDEIGSNWINVGGKEIALTDYEVWGVNGFTKITKIIRHNTRKKLVRILTHTGIVDVTEDHSLLTINNKIISPRNIVIGTELLHSFPKEFPVDNGILISKEEAFVYGLFYADGSTGKYDTQWSNKYSWAINNQNIKLLRKCLEILNTIEKKNGLTFKILDTMKSSSAYKLVPTGGLKEITERYREIFYNEKGQKIIPEVILNASPDIKKSFFEGYYSGDGDRWGRNKLGNTRLSNKGKIGAMGLYYLMTSLGYKVSINSRFDKLDVLRLTATRSYQRKKPYAIKKIVPLGISTDYVYDLETENHHFHAGIGQLIVHNTDSVFLLNPSKESMQKISEWSKKELDLDLEEEKTYQFLALSDRKKNYIGIYEDTHAVDIKGLVAKKKNTPEFIKKVFNDLIQILKNIHNQEQFSKARDTIIKIVRSNLKKIGKPDTFSLEDYAINISIQKNLDKYDKVLPQHVRAAKDWIEYKLNEARAQGADESVINSIKNTYSQGDSIEFIKSKGSSGAKVIEMATLQDIDTKKYKELLQSALEQVLDALGITFEEVKGIKKLDSFF